MRNLFHNQSGQTVLETLAALAVISIAVVALVTLIVMSIKTTSAIEGEAIAINLAHEGIEAVQVLRDSNWLMLQDGLSTTWSTGLVAAAHRAAVVWDEAAQQWQLDFSPQRDERIYLTPDGWYRQRGVMSSTWAETPFSRQVTIDLICRGNDASETIMTDGIDCPVPLAFVGLQVTSSVTWSEGERSHVATLTDRFYDWKPTARTTF